MFICVAKRNRGVEAQKRPEEFETLSPLLPSLRSLIYTATLYAVGNVFLLFSARQLFGYASVANTLFSLVVVYFRLRPLLATRMVPGTKVVEEAAVSAKARLTFLAVLAATVVPLLLVYLLPFDYWAVLVYFLVSCWPLANIGFYFTLNMIRRRRHIEFYRLQRFRRVLDENYLVATGIVVAETSSEPARRR